MAFARPTLQEIDTRSQSDFETRLQAAGGFLRRSVVRVLARVVAGASHLLHGHIAFVAKQVIWDTAIGAYLERWAAIWLVSKKAATFAAGDVTMTGTDPTLIPQGTQFSRADGFLYASTADAIISGGTATVPVLALEAGSLGEADAGVQITLTAPIAGVDSAGVVAAGGLTGGNDEETTQQLRERFLARIRRPPLGGAVQDYEQWALEVPGVTRVWVLPLYLGPGWVGVTFVRDDDTPIIPDASEVQEVQDYIDSKRPVTAQVYAFAPIEDLIDFTISVTPDTPEIRAAIEAELTDMIFRDAEPGGTIYLSRMHEAISIAEGESDHVLTAPVADHVSGAGELPVMGTITWV